MADKPKLAIYWASSCGGCEIAVVNLHEKLLEVDRHFDFMFCPCLLDTKVKDIEALPDGAIAVTLFNGAIRTSENLRMARLLRSKSAALIAFGACSSGGGIPALSNLSSRVDHLRTIYGETAPAARYGAPEGELELPDFFDSVQTLAGVVDVDYSIAGCPPEPRRVWEIVETLVAGRPLPPRGSVLGGGVSSVCRECARERKDKKIARFFRSFEIVPDPVQCLLDQGLPCMGVVTRDGCGALCPAVNVGCTGCYGPAEGVVDQGAKMLAALGSVLDCGGHTGRTERQTVEAAERAVAQLPDLAGTFYKFSLAGSVLRRKRP